MQTRSLFAALTAIALFLPACSKKPVVVSGQLFVVTAGRENVKMGLTGIHVVPDAQFKSLAATLAAKIREPSKMDAQNRVDGDARTTFIKYVLSLETPELLVPELPQLREEAVGDTAGKLLEELQRPTEMSLGMATSLLMQAIPPEAAKTDADGRFTLSIQSKVWLVAVGERSMGKESESYLWITPCELPDKTQTAPILISNDSNLHSLDDLYALLATQAGMPPDLKAHTQAEVSKELAQWIEAAKGRATAAISAAKERVEKEKAETLAKAEREKATKVALVIQRLEKAITAKDPFGADDVLGELVALIPEDARMAGWRGQVAAVPPRRTLVVDLGSGVTMDFMLIRPGTFTMGSDKGGDEGAHQVTLTKPFYLGKYEVTQEQWQQIMGSNPSEFKSAKNPVEEVSWDDCQSFIEKLRKKVPGQTFRLPTEAEWEHACRAGTIGDYAGDLDAMAWYSSNSGRGTHPVGEKKPNAWGLHDMHGNVWEWCADWYGDYPNGAAIDPTGSNTGSKRVYRGGSWCNVGPYCRSARRNWDSPGYRDFIIGFRVAAVPGGS
jgi:formylglycine-generating enzyme required for sulfatase activity